MKCRRYLMVPLAIVLSVAIGPSLACAGPITFFSTINNTDASFAGTGGLRSGAGTMTVAGVSGPVHQSYTWWHGPTPSNNPAINANGLINGNLVTGTNIGVGFDNFWGFPNSQAY